MKTTAFMLAGLASLAVAPASASTFTLNDMDAFCVEGPCTDLNTGSRNVANTLGIGAVYGLTDPSFQDGNGNTYAARVTVVDVASRHGDTGKFSSINASPVNAWIHYKFEFVESFDIDTLTFGANRVVENVQFVNIEDIDSNRGQDFTDVAGVNLDLVGTGSALEEGGFLPESETGTRVPNAPGFNFVRLGKGNDGNWRNENNVGANASDEAKAAVTATFGDGSDLAGFQFIWGSTGAPRNNVRGWDLTISASPSIDPAPIPVPASLPLLMGALGALAMWRRRSA
ncbi:MAG: VPLPA-CTERM sorting domain-containing protein [Pseudomonadota bacterium]